MTKDYDSIEPKLPEENRDGDTDTKEWKTVQKLILKADKVRRQKEKDWETIMDAWDDQFSVERNKGHRYLTGKLFFILVWRITKDMILPKARVHLHGAQRAHEIIIEHFLRQGVKESGLDETFHDESGIRTRMVKYGDAFAECGIGEEGFPTIFRNTSLSEI